MEAIRDRREMRCNAAAEDAADIDVAGCGGGEDGRDPKVPRAMLTLYAFSGGGAAADPVPVPIRPPPPVPILGCGDAEAGRLSKALDPPGEGLTPMPAPLARESSI